MLHHVFRLRLDGHLCQTKLDHPQRVLDVGTGTGIWAIDCQCPYEPLVVEDEKTHLYLVADQYPSAEVIGVDLSPIQPAWSDTSLRTICACADCEQGSAQSALYH